MWGSRLACTSPRGTTRIHGLGRLFCGVNGAMKLEQRFNTDVECEVASEEVRLLVGAPEQEIQRLVNSEPRSALLMDIAVDGRRLGAPQIEGDRSEGLR
jgi:hypothetical protein